MALFKFLKLSVFIAVIIIMVGSLISAESTLLIIFHQTPPPMSRYSTAVFHYSVEKPDGSNTCNNHSCSVYCEIDGHTLTPCPSTIVLKNLTVNRQHNLLLNVTTCNGERNSSVYSWFIDAISPTAIISSKQNYTNAKKITIDVTFSEVCPGNGGFKCINSFNCDVIINGPAHVESSSLRIIKPDIKFSLDVFLSKSTYGRVVIGMADNFCTDEAGNYFTRTNGSTIIIHFDRRPVLADLWTSVPSYELEINKVSRTVFATNNLEDLEIFLDFSIPIVNSTEQILNALRVNSGNLMPIHNRRLGNRRFVFKLKGMSKTEIITIELRAELLNGITNTPVSPVSPITFLYDSTNPRVELSTSSPRVTNDRSVNVIVEFTKPVFGFEASMVEVDEGKLTSFKELSRALYSFNVLAAAQNVVSITVPPGKVNDVSGNLNLPSNQLEVKHYSTPFISTALHSFVTAGVLATTLAAAILSLSSANLGAVDTLNSRSNNIVTSDPSMNLQGMIGHLQGFVLSVWLLANQPIEYSETMKGLRWLIPHQKLPWRKDCTLIWPNHVNLAEEKLTRKFRNLFIEFPPNEGDFDYTKHNVSMKDTSYGQPLTSNEYFTYFLRGEPLSATNVAKKLENYKGWQDLEMNLFWLGVGGGSLLVLHVFILLFLKWRTGTSTHGILSIPRFELLLLILVLPCISQSAAFVIRGGTTGGIIVGALLLAIPAAFILSVCLFLITTIFSGSFAQYKEIRQMDIEEAWHTKLLGFFIGRPAAGKWFYREGLPLSFLPQFGILFENRKGPTLFVFNDQNDPNSMPKWTESSQSGIGRMKAVSTDDSNEEIKIPMSRRFLGCAQSSYIVLDLLRRVILGVISGAYSAPKLSQSLFAFTITVVQFMYLTSVKPYIRRGVHVVESISLLCQIGIFGLSISINSSNPIEAKDLGYVMLALLFITFIVQIINEWYALVKCLLRLSHPDTNSFRLGLKFAAKGLLLPFLPRKLWSRIIPGSFKLKPGLAPVPTSGPETEFGRRDTRVPCVESFSAMTATVVPVVSPGGSPGLNVAQTTGSTTVEATVTRQIAEEGRRDKGIKLDPKSELKKLRELAKASFSGDKG